MASDEPRLIALGSLFQALGPIAGTLACARRRSDVACYNGIECLHVAHYVQM